MFARVVEDGKTYPMEVAEGEKYSRQAFESYFFAADVIVGILSGKGSNDQQVGVQDAPSLSSLCEDGQPLVWEEVVAGFYYVCCFISWPSPGKRLTSQRYPKRSNLTTQVDPPT